MGHIHSISIDYTNVLCYYIRVIKERDMRTRNESVQLKEEIVSLWLNGERIKYRIAKKVGVTTAWVYAVLKEKELI